MLIHHQGNVDRTKAEGAGAVSGREVPGAREGQGDAAGTGVAGMCPGLRKCCWVLMAAACLSPSGTKRGQR